MHRLIVLFLKKSTLAIVLTSYHNQPYHFHPQHYIPIDLSWHDNIQNTSVQDAEVFVPLEAPSGLITATVSR
jgi:hypothetical protein